MLRSAVAFLVALAPSLDGFKGVLVGCSGGEVVVGLGWVAFRGFDSLTGCGLAVSVGWRRRLAVGCLPPFSVVGFVVAGAVVP